MLVIDYQENQVKEISSQELIVKSIPSLAKLYIVVTKMKNNK